MAKKAVPKPGPPSPPRPALTDRQREVYEFLRETIVARGYGPTVREIAQHFGMASPNSVTGHLQALQKKGLITRDAYVSRAIQLTEPPRPQAALPLLGGLQIGPPLDLLTDPPERIEFANLFASANHGCLRVIGHGLQEDFICEGDYVVIRRQSDCRDGDLILGLLDGQTTAIKRYYRESLRIRLESINRSKPPVFVTKVMVIGLVVGIIRQY